MELNKQLYLTCLSALCVAATVAHAQLVSDDFELRRGGMLGDNLAPNTTPVGNAAYAVTTGSASSNLVFGNVGGEGVAQVAEGRGNVTNSFAIPSMPTTGTITFSATVNFDPVNLAHGGGIIGPWIGFTEAGTDGGILNSVSNSSNADDYMILRLITLGDNAGRIIMTTNAGGARNTRFSSAGSALDLTGGGDYLLSLEYDFDTFDVIATVTDSAMNSTSASIALADAAAVSRAQFDFTGLAESAALADLPYFKNISVIAEPQATAISSMVHAYNKGEWVDLIDDDNLDSWTKHGGVGQYELKDGVIVGRSVLKTPNTFLVPQGVYGDFELEFEVRCERINTGVQIRSKTTLPNGRKRINGPQVEIEQGPGQAGYIYGEAAGGWRSPEPNSKDPAVKEHDYYKNDEWNHYRVLAVGPRIQTWLNGEPIADLTDKKLYQTHPEGLLGLQVHGHNKAGVKIEWRNIRIREIESSN